MGAALVDWPPALRDERTVRYAHGRELEHRPELERQARSTRMITAGCIDEQHVRQLRQRAKGGLQECALAESKQAWLVRRTRITGHQCRASVDARGRPSRIARVARAALPAGEADEDAADPRPRPEAPRRRPERGEPCLLLDQLPRRERPREHRRILAAWTRWWQRLMQPG